MTHKTIIFTSTMLTPNEDRHKAAVRIVDANGNSTLTTWGGDSAKEAAAAAVAHLRSLVDDAHDQLAAHGLMPAREAVGELATDLKHALEREAAVIDTMLRLKSEREVLAKELDAVKKLLDVSRKETDNFRKKFQEQWDNLHAQASTISQTQALLDSERQTRANCERAVERLGNELDRIRTSNEELRGRLKQTEGDLAAKRGAQSDALVELVRVRDRVKELESQLNQERLLRSDADNQEFPK